MPGEDRTVMRAVSGMLKDAPLWAKDIVEEALADAELRQALRDLGLGRRVRAAAHGVELRLDPVSGALCEVDQLSGGLIPRAPSAK